MKRVHFYQPAALRCFATDYGRKGNLMRTSNMSNESWRSLRGYGHFRHALCWLAAILLSTAVISTAQAAVIFKAATSAYATTGGGTISHVGSGNADSLDENCGTITATPFTGGSAAVGDLLIATVNSQSDNPTLSSPSGWTELYASTYSGQEFTVRIYYRFADGTGADNFSISQTSGCESLAAQVSRFSNVDPATPFRTAPLSNSGGSGNCGTNTRCQNSNNIDSGTQTGVVAGDMLLVASFVNDNSYICEAAGWNESFEERLNLNRDLALGLHYQLQTSGGSKSISGWSIDTGSSSCSSPNTDENYGVIFALRPAPAGPQLTINVPPGTVAGDVMLASVTATPDTISETPPAGWTLIRTVTQAGSTPSYLSTYYRLATAAEPASYTWLFSTTGFGGAVGGIASFTGVDNTMPITAEAGVATGSGLGHAAPSVSSVLPDAMLVTIHEMTSAASWSPPGGMTEAVDIASQTPDNANGISMQINYEPRPTVGPTGSRTATASANADSGATQSVILRPRPMACFADDFNRANGSPGPDYIVSSNSGTFGSPKIVGGRLRLTDASGNVATMANLQHIFPGAGNRIEVEFEHYAYGGSGADGIAFILSDYAIPPAPGGYGGSLGYANTTNSPGFPGFAGGWIGIGLDEYGNFSNPNEGRNGGPGFRVDAIAIRGSGVGTTGYTYHAGTNTLTPGVDGNGSQVPPDKYRIIVDHSNSVNAMVSVERDTGSGYVTLVAPYDAKAEPGQATVPANWVLSYTGSTGGATNIHEIDNLNICATYITSLVGTDHYSISHSGSGVTCNSELVTITAHDASHSPIDASTNTITLTTSTARGTWSRVVTGGGTLVDATAGDGAATYTFPGGETSVTLAFNYTNPIAVPETFSINVTDGTSTEHTGSALAGEDPDLTFYDSGFIFNNETDASQTIPTQISGKNSNINPGGKLITLQAVRTDTNDPAVCLPVFQNQTLDIDFAAECRNPTSCSAGSGGDLTLNGVLLTSTNNDNGATGTTGYDTRSVTFDNDGKLALVINYPDAGLVQLHARHNILLDDGSGTPSGNYMYGSSNDFVVRPFGLAFTDVRNAGADATYGNGDDVLNPGGTASAGDGFIAAEDDFRVSIQGVQYNAADDTDSDGIPDIGAVLTDNGTTPNFAWGTAITTLPSNFTPAGGVAGSILGSNTLAQAGFSGGGNTSGDIYYNNVGSVTLQALATDYINPGVSVYGYSLPVGRFFPDHFALINGSVTPACGGFNYMDQPFSNVTLELQAQGALNGVVTNYDTAAGYTTGTTNTLAEDLAAGNEGVDMSARFSDPAADWSAASFTVSSAAETFARSATGPDGPYQQLVFGANVNDMDSRPVLNPDINPGTTGDCTLDSSCTGIRIDPATFDVRYGRLVLQNAFGSELVPLAIPFRVEYYDTASMGYLLSAGDSCTAYNGGMMNVLSSTGLTPANLVFSGSSTAVSGLPNTAIPLLVTQAAPGEIGSANIQLPVPAWLQFDWDDNMATPDTDPDATITFGIYGGSDSTIFIREVY